MNVSKEVREAGSFCDIPFLSCWVPSATGKIQHRHLPSLLTNNLESTPVSRARTRITQVNNAIVRSVLQGCSALRQLYLDGCRHVTDAGFHLQQSPFYVLLGAVSLETISVQGCPQVGAPCCARCRSIFCSVCGFRFVRLTKRSSPFVLGAAFLPKT